MYLQFLNHRMNARRISLFIILIAGINCSVSAQYKLYEKGLENYKAGKFTEAITNLSDYLTKPAREKSLDVEVHYLRGLALFKTQNFKNATEDFKEAIHLNHSNQGNIYWFLAKCYEQTGFYPDAIEAYDSATKKLDKDKEILVKLLYERSQVYLKLDNRLLAYRDLKKGFDIQPGNEEIKKQLEKLDKEDPTADAGKTTMLVKEPVVRSESGGDKTLADFYKDEKRYALVIGNSRYPKEIGELRNPVNDATDMATELQNSNFEVQLLTNVTYGQMRAALMKFKDKIDAGDRDKTVALFYFAGHGLRLEDENYLVPIDARIEYQDDIWRNCFPVQKIVLSNMENSNSRMNIVILDACRSNPFPSLTRAASQQGLTEMKKARGTFIAYATAPGSVAIDGTGRNGLYTQELLKTLRKPGLTIEQVFKEVRLNVHRLSGERQNTWDSSNITGEFYFKF